MRHETLKYWLIVSLLSGAVADLLGQSGLPEPCFLPHTRLAHGPSTLNLVCQGCGLNNTYAIFRKCVATVQNRECWGGPNGRSVFCVGQCQQFIYGDDRACTPLPPVPPPGCEEPSEEEIPGLGCEGASPLLISIRGNRLELTDAENGVRFDIDNDGILDRIAWTQPGSDDVFLYLDMNGNNRVDNGSELFGNYSPQFPTETPNGFLALAVYDRPEYGGNNDGRISSEDSVFQRLGFWRDSNHDGVSQTEELRRVSSTPVRAFSLRYRESRRQDEHGNQFRYIGRVLLEAGENGQRMKFAVDVFFVVAEG